MKNYRIIVKCQGGFLTIAERKSNSPLDCLKSFGCKNVYTIEEQSGEYYFTVFALKGSSVLIASSDIIESRLIQTYYPKTNIHGIHKPVTELNYTK
jgi:hypothetical protein